MYVSDYSKHVLLISHHSHWHFLELFRFFIYFGFFFGKQGECIRTHLRYLFSMHFSRSQISIREQFTDLSEKWVLNVTDEFQASTLQLHEWITTRHYFFLWQEARGICRHKPYVCECIGRSVDGSIKIRSNWIEFVDQYFPWCKIRDRIPWFMIWVEQTNLG